MQKGLTATAHAIMPTQQHAQTGPPCFVKEINQAQTSMLDLPHTAPTCLTIQPTHPHMRCMWHMVHATGHTAYATLCCDGHTGKSSSDPCGSVVRPVHTHKVSVTSIYRSTWKSGPLQPPPLLSGHSYGTVTQEVCTPGWAAQLDECDIHKYKPKHQRQYKKL